MGRVAAAVGLFDLAGFVLLIAGAWLIGPALGLIVAGLICLVIAFALTPRGGRA